jgi:hypothetical protein
MISEPALSCQDNLLGSCDPLWDSCPQPIASPDFSSAHPPHRGLFDLPLLSDGLLTPPPFGVRPAIAIALFFVICACAQADTITLAWDANTQPDLAGYRLYYEDMTGVQVAIMTMQDLGNTTSATLSNLLPGHIYYFVVTDYNISGVESGPSNQVRYLAPTAPAAPSNLVALAVSRSEIDLSWADNSNNETGF